MNKIKNDLYNDFWDWLNSVSIKYKNYEIKNAIVAHKYIQLNQLMHINNVNHFNLRKILSSIKWEIRLNLINNKIPSKKMDFIGGNNLNNQLNLRDKNLYVINFSPTDSRHFLHIGPLAENDDSSLVITVRNDVYDYFNKIEKPVVLINIYNPWRNKKDLEINIPSISSKKESLLSLDLFSLISLSRAASLIDLLDIVTNKNGLPKTLITLQDFHFFDSVFASYFLGKIPTITLQHGLIDAANILWKYLISDKIIVWGLRQSEILKSLGVSTKKIKILGTAKYDLYIDRIEGKLKNNRNKRVLLGIQQTMFFKENDEIIFNFINKLLFSRANYTVSIRFHPAITKENRKKIIQKLKKLNLNYGVKVDISSIENPLEDISKSAIILVSCSGLAIEAMLLKKPVIEYLSKKENMIKFGDYRDFSLHALEGKNAEALIVKLLNNDDFYNKIVEKQNIFVNFEIMPPPAIPRILNFINRLNDNKRSVKNNQ